MQKDHLFNMKKKNRLIRLAGFIILTVSCLLFILIPVVPLVGFSAGQVAGISAGLLISGEILFYLSLLILGRSFYDKIKSRLKFWKTKTSDSGITSENK